MIALAAKEKGNDSTTLASFRTGESHVHFLSALISSSLSSAILLSNSNAHVSHCQSKINSKEIRAAWEFLIKWTANVGKHYQNTNFLFSEGELKKTAVYLSIIE